MIGKFNVHIFFNGVDTLDARARSGHPVLADKEFGGRREVGNYFGLRTGERNSFSHDAGHGRRGGVYKLVGNCNALA